MSDEEKCKHMIATFFTESIKSKGEYSQELADIMHCFDETDFIIPNYIKEGLKWIMELEL